MADVRGGCTAVLCRVVLCRFIWLTGWSIWTETRMVREPDRDETCPTLGELLIQKANEGVNVSGG